MTSTTSLRLSKVELLIVGGMEEFDSYYEGSGLELFHLSDILDFLGKGNKHLGEHSK